MKEHLPKAHLLQSEPTRTFPTPATACEERLIGRAGARYSQRDPSPSAHRPQHSIAPGIARKSLSPATRGSCPSRDRRQHPAIVPGPRVTCHRSRTTPPASRCDKRSTRKRFEPIHDRQARSITITSGSGWVPAPRRHFHLRLSDGWESTVGFQLCANERPDIWVVIGYENSDAVGHLSDLGMLRREPGRSWPP